MGLRAGGFTGTLDPFGRGRGGLGRYNITGDTIQSLADFEAFAVATAWANGMASDEEYLASLRHLVELAPAGTRDRVTAENRLHDAEYSIGRNQIVRDVNNATTSSTRRSALESLLAYEQTHLGSMTATDSQAYRDELDRIATVRGDLRQNRYSDLLEKVNKGQASTQRLLDLARALGQEALADGDPDSDEWSTTVGTLTERVKDERITTLYQDYQHDRVTSAQVVAELDARLAELEPGSAAFAELSRSREDFVERAGAKDADRRESDIQSQRADGKIDDVGYLAYLRDVYNAETPGTAAWVRAGTRLREFTFSLAEDKLRYDVTKGSRPVTDLIRFYEGYRATMDPGGERWRALGLTIDALKRGGAAGGAGGGAGGGGGGLGLGPKLIDGQAALADILGGRQAPPGFADLFRIDPNSPAAYAWWKNNLASASNAFRDRASTWTYYDPSGNAYALPFNPGMMGEFDSLDLGYMRFGLSTSQTIRDAQQWVGRIVSASERVQSHGAQLTMDVFDRVWDSLDRAKRMALAGGRIAEYANLSAQQRELAGAIAGDDAHPGSPYITLDNRTTILNHVAGIVPFDRTGAVVDSVLAMIDSGAIATKVDRDTNLITEARLDPDKGYITQNEAGGFDLVPVDPSQFRLDPDNEQLIPLYQDDHVLGTVSFMGEDAQVWQPFDDPTTAKGLLEALPVYRDNLTAAGTLTAGRGGRSFGPAQPAADDYPTKVIVGRHGVSLHVFTMFTVEGFGASRRKVMWVSLGTPGPGGPIVMTSQQGPGGPATYGVKPDTWMRVGDGVAVPRIVLPANVTFDEGSGKWRVDGKDEGDVRKILGLARFWSSGDAAADGSLGQPGMKFVMRKTDRMGGLDWRPDAIIDAEERDRLFLSARRFNAPPPRAQREVTSAEEAAVIRRGRPAPTHDELVASRRTELRAAQDVARHRGTAELLPVESRSKVPLPRTYGLSPMDIERRDLARPARPAIPPPATAPLAPLKPMPKPELTPLAPPPRPPLAPPPPPTSQEQTTFLQRGRQGQQ